MIKFVTKLKIFFFLRNYLLINRTVAKCLDKNRNISICIDRNVIYSKHLHNIAENVAIPNIIIA